MLSSCPPVCCYYPIPNHLGLRLKSPLLLLLKATRSTCTIAFSSVKNSHPLHFQENTCRNQDQDAHINKGAENNFNRNIDPLLEEFLTTHVKKIQEEEEEEEKAEESVRLSTNMWRADLKAVVGQRINVEGIVSSVMVIARDRSLAVPNVSVPDIRHIDWVELRKRGFKGVVFDKDNTITVPYSLKLWGPLESSLHKCKSAFGNNIVVFSNSAGLYEYDPDGLKARILENSIGIKVLRHKVKKPAGSSEEIEKHFGCPSSQLIMVGDRPFTDIVYGNRNGFLTILTQPLSLDEEPTIVKQALRSEQWRNPGLLSFWLSSLHLKLLSAVQGQKIPKKRNPLVEKNFSISATQRDITTPLITPATMLTPNSTVPASPATGGGGSWCVAIQSAPRLALQAALDYACGDGGADCSAILPGGSCYNPVTVRDHASYAFNNYYQKHPLLTSCNFAGTAYVTTSDPSYEACEYPSTSTNSSILNITNPSSSTVFGSQPSGPSTSAVVVESACCNSRGLLVSACLLALLF